MKKKDKFIYRCQSCGGQAHKWMGKCPDCGLWDTLVEERIIASSDPSSSKSHDRAVAVPMDSIECDETLRLTTGTEEFDRVLGGGIVTGSLVLIGGDPGIGKSTLMLQVMSRISESGRKTLYICKGVKSALDSL